MKLDNNQLDTNEWSIGNQFFIFYLKIFEKNLEIIDYTTS